MSCPCWFRHPEAVEALNTSLESARGITLAVRLGIHTGLVVIGEMGGGGRQEQLALGEVPNVASRIQGLAEPNTSAISEATYRLVAGYFICALCGEYTLRGVSQPLHIYRVLGASGIHSRLDVAQTRGLTLVGRGQDLVSCWNVGSKSKLDTDTSYYSLVSAGIGKSRLVQTLKEHIAHSPIRWECRSSYFEHTALFPITDLFNSC